jgi:hypothetical protein
VPQGYEELLKNYNTRSLGKECWYFSEKAKLCKERFEKIVARCDIALAVLAIVTLAAGGAAEDGVPFMYAGFFMLLAAAFIPTLIPFIYKQYAMRYIAIPDVIRRCERDSAFKNTVLSETNNGEMKDLIREITKGRSD